MGPVDNKTISAVMAELGRRGGKVGGKRSLETMTPEERIERAKKASAAGVAARRKKAATAKKASTAGSKRTKVA